ncbi:MAG: hypothetical protein MK220_04020 [Candidatus Poseidoniia archaeon]|nr:hypothetical protein [Candidatus Poseidoniia archaeon]
MRVQRRRDGTVRLRLEHDDDLYHLDLLLEPGDAVRASTKRREATQADRLRPGRGAKQKLTLTLAVEKVEYQPFGQRLRCHGPITEAKRDVGQHHTLLLGPGDDLTLAKPEWAPHHKRRLREAAQPAVRALAVAVEADSVVLAEVRPYGIRELRALNRAGGKGAGGETQKAFFARVIASVADALGSGGTGGKAALIVIGPGFLKEDLLKQARADAPEQWGGATAVTAGQGGLAGVHEALRTGKLPQAAAQAQLQRELEAVAALSDALARDRATYGAAQLRAALEAGAGERLLILAPETRSPQGRQLLALAEQARTEVIEVSPHHHGGEILAGLGGAAAVLRYKL